MTARLSGTMHSQARQAGEKVLRLWSPKAAGRLHRTREDEHDEPSLSSRIETAPSQPARLNQEQPGLHAVSGRLRGPPPIGSPAQRPPPGGAAMLHSRAAPGPSSPACPDSWFAARHHLRLRTVQHPMLPLGPWKLPVPAWPPAWQPEPQFSSQKRMLQGRSEQVRPVAVATVATERWPASDSLQLLPLPPVRQPTAPSWLDRDCQAWKRPL
mmetsp:Transcript_7541/g.22297  ORF Transcript_7541/g.22297 Transcript_7541/m.22297 type:complete len:212 (-) Transcript_7541:228-863(-)